MTNPITPPPPHLLKKFSEQAREDSKKRGHPGYCKTFAILCIEWAMNSQSTPNDCQIRSSDITPPPELVRQWFAAWESSDNEEMSFAEFAIPSAARWGADQELEACCDTLQRHAHWDLGVFELMDDRRPNPPSLKEQALRELADAYDRDKIDDTTYGTIRRALEALPND